MNFFLRLIVLSASFSSFFVVSHSLHAKNVIVLGDERVGNECCTSCNCVKSCPCRNASLNQCRTNACGRYYQGMLLEDDRICEDYCDNLARVQQTRNAGWSLDYCKQVVAEDARRKVLEAKMRADLEVVIRKEIEEKVRKELADKIQRELEAVKSAPASEPIK